MAEGMDTADEVVVIGGGVAGCTTGYLLSSLGYDVTLVEKNSIGGLLREIEFNDGFYCDSAPHILFYDPVEEREVRSLFGRFSTFRQHEFYAKTYPTGDLSDPHDYPVSTANVDRWPDDEEIREELVSVSPPADAETFEEYVRPRVGDRLYKRYFGPYTSKHWGVDPSRVTGDWFDFKLNFPESEQPFFPDSAAVYPDERYSNILTGMVRDCTVRHATVTDLKTADDRVESLETADGDHLSGDYYVNTIDPSVLLNSPESLTYRSMVIIGVQLWCDERLFPEHVDWGYFPRDYAFTRVTDYGFTDQGLPPSERVLSFEFPCFLDDNTYAWDRDRFESYIGSFLREQNVEATIKEVVLRRAPRAYPLPVRDQLDQFEKFNQELDAYGNLFNIGRVATYEYIWIKDIVQQALDAVENATGLPLDLAPDGRVVKSS